MGFSVEKQGMEIKLDISGYTKDYEDIIDSPWCKVSFSFKFRDIISYTCDNCGVLEAAEVEILEKQLDDLLQGNIQETKEIGFIEPDWEMTLVPQINVIESGKYVYAAPGYEIEDIRLMWKINLWCDGLTVNNFSTELWREEITELRDYLRSVMNDSNY